MGFWSSQKKVNDTSVPLEKKCICVHILYSFYYTVTTLSKSGPIRATSRKTVKELVPGYNLNHSNSYKNHLQSNSFDKIYIDFY